MPLIHYAHTHICERVADRQIGSGIVHQYATTRRFSTSQDESGLTTAKVLLLVTLHDPATGARLREPGFDGYTIELKADNDAIVDAATGEILAVRWPLGHPARQTDAEWEAQANAFEQPVMWQGDAFEAMRDNQPVVVGQMVRQHIQQANQPPFSRFG